MLKEIENFETRPIQHELKRRLNHKLQNRRGNLRPHKKQKQSTAANYKKFANVSAFQKQ